MVLNIGVPGEGYVGDCVMWIHLYNTATAAIFIFLTSVLDSTRKEHRVETKIVGHRQKKRKLCTDTAGSEIYHVLGMPCSPLVCGRM